MKKLIPNTLRQFITVVAIPAGAICAASAILGHQVEEVYDRVWKKTTKGIRPIYKGMTV